jgi:hypothetical protein
MRYVKRNLQGIEQGGEQGAILFGKSKVWLRSTGEEAVRAKSGPYASASGNGVSG